MILQYLKMFEVWTQIKSNGYLCFEYPYTIILVLGIYINILLIGIHNLDVDKI